LITAHDIRDLRTSSRDYLATQELKQHLAEVHRQRQSFYLTSQEFDEILHWKLRNQYHRRSKWRLDNTDEIIRAITGLALSLEHSNKDYELDLRMNILRSLRGVEVPVASAVLALAYPDTYAVIDFRGWRQVFGEKRETYTVPQYKRYLCEVRRIARELEWPVQEADLAIWEYDLRTNQS